MDDGTRCPRCGEVLNDWEMKQGWHLRTAKGGGAEYTVRCEINAEPKSTQEVT